MGLYITIRALECLLATSLLIQTFEFIRMRDLSDIATVWSWDVQRKDVAHAPAWLRNTFDWLYRDHIHHLHLMLRAGAAASLYAGVSLTSSAFLFISTIVILVRWRGAFNGGSDFMTLVVLTGVLASQVAKPFTGPVLAWKAGLWYIAIHTMTSYFISGTIKLLQTEWRDGRILTHFLDGGMHGPLPDHSVFRHRVIAIAASWSFIVWECLFPVALAGPRIAMLWCAVAGVFHLLVFRFFGLNRFVWAWAASFPAIVYCAGQWQT